MKTDNTMNNVDAEVEEAEILEAEVVQSRRPVRSGKMSVLAMLLALAALIAAAAGLFISYQSRESASMDLATLKASLAAVQKETGDLGRQLSAAQDAFRAQVQQLMEQKRVLADQRQALAAHNQSLADQQESLKQERVRLDQAGREIREAMQSVHRRIGGDNSYWMAAEAAYLIQIANHRLYLEWDVNTAISALETADARLRDSTDSVWIPVREILALEIASLKGVEVVDVETMALRLSGLAGGVKELKLLGTGPAPPAADAISVDEKQPESGKRNLKTLFHDLWQGFKSVMVIRHHGQPVSALLPPGQQLFIQQNLQLQLEAARVSLLRGNQPLFDSSLKSAVQLLSEYFDTDDVRVNTYLNEIEALTRFNVRPQLPDISASTIALREQLKKVGEH